MSSCAPGIDSRFQQGKRGWMSLDNIVTFSEHTGPRNYRKEAKGVWNQLDCNGDGTVDQNEIRDWLLKNNIFSAMSNDDSQKTIQKMFAEIDKNNDGTLDFDEFCTFYKMVQHEKTQMLHASRHHITALPPSVVKFNKKAFTTEAIEILLQDKIQQFTSQDSDRFRQILSMFKTQVQRARDHENSDSHVMGVTKRQFNTVLMWLGLFATKQQADALFEKYDANGDGVLTVHEFLTRARPTDYPGRAINTGERYSFRTGKRMYLEDSLNGRPVRPRTPPDDVFHVSERTLAERIREKMGNMPGVGQHYNETPLALNDLMKKFGFYDPQSTGFCSARNLRRALQNLNLSIGDSHMDLLMDKFAGPMQNGQQTFNYPKFSQYVYPGKPASAALPQHTSLQLRKPNYGQYKKQTMDFSRPMIAVPSRGGSQSLSQPGSRSGSRGNPSAVGSAQQSLKPLSRTMSSSQIGQGGPTPRRSMSASASTTALRSGRAMAAGASMTMAPPMTMAHSQSAHQFHAPAMQPMVGSFS